ncbi:MAG: lysylphosphatidylglycerol synthase domain-containing protein [Comamonadaceae bacterium]|nr:lysylphosphatidylglycerol synthase domain-containing protein [Comamonadaceae bacterium]
MTPPRTATTCRSSRAAAAAAHRRGGRHCGAGSASRSSSPSRARRQRRAQDGLGRRAGCGAGLPVRDAGGRRRAGRRQPRDLHLELRPDRPASHRPPGPARVAAVGFISYAFNLNLGSLVGGVAFRYKIYSKLGLKPGVITRVLGYSLLTNWLGYLALGGAVLLARPPELPADWEIGRVGLRLLGGGMLAAACAYMAFAAFATRREWTVRGHEILLPPLRIALLQLLVSCASWAVIASICHVLLGRQLPYVDVLTALLIAAIAGVVTHLPAGLGVIEAVFVALLGARLGEGPVLAALLVYRAVYYLAPLVAATALYFALEALGRRRRGTAEGRDAAEAAD